MTTTQNWVPLHSSESGNRRIERTMWANVAFFRRKSRPDRRQVTRNRPAVGYRKGHRGERAVLGFTGTVLAGTSDRRWLALPALITAFRFQHAIQGWCPPVPILRKLGFRTSYEIEEERRALMALRGDFGQRADSADAALQMSTGSAKAPLPA
jgi:hypothetical protein